jgi:hypothetical protein
MNSPLRSKPLILTGIVLASVVGGYAAGWLVATRKSGTAGTVYGALLASSVEKTAVTAEAKKVPTEQAVEGMLKDWERIKNLPPAEFAVHMADAWLAVGDPRAHLRRSLCLMNCDTERAVAFYQEYKSRKGLTLKEDASDLRELITMIGRKDGRSFLEQMLQLSPSGSAELDSLIHGWASVDPQASVAWLNDLPEGSPIYSQMLKGLLWGIAENSPSTAAKVFQELAPADRNDATVHVSDSTVFYHGLTGLNSLLSEISDPEVRRQMAAATGTGLAMRAKPSEYVQEMAIHITADNRRLSGCFSHMAQRWTQAAPADALAWLTNTAKEPGCEAAITTMTRQLSVAGLNNELVLWMQANPEAPGRTIIEQALNVVSR